MCVPSCQEKIIHNLSRREFLKGIGLAAAASAVSATPALAAIPTIENKPVRPAVSAIPHVQVGFFSKLVDLTHTLIPTFPTFFGEQQLELEAVKTLEKDGFNINRWVLNEHTGTHLDAPFHFSDLDSADQIPLANLIGPLAVIDIRARAEENPDAQLTLDDLKAWESTYGELPAGAIVAQLSGWDAHVNSDKFRNADDKGGLHFPGFHIEAIEFLLAEREVNGIIVDTLSLDYGASTDFAVHYKWLPANKWGIEGAANLGELPAFGATAIVAAPKIGGASGGLSRVLALV